MLPWHPWPWPRHVLRRSCGTRGRTTPTASATQKPMPATSACSLKGCAASSARPPPGHCRSIMWSWPRETRPPAGTPGTTSRSVSHRSRCASPCHRCLPRPRWTWGPSSIPTRPTSGSWGSAWPPWCTTGTTATSACPSPVLSCGVPTSLCRPPPGLPPSECISGRRQWPSSPPWTAPPAAQTAPPSSTQSLCPLVPRLSCPWTTGGRPGSPSTCGHKGTPSLEPCAGLNPTHRQMRFCRSDTPSRTLYTAHCSLRVSTGRPGTSASGWTGQQTMAGRRAHVLQYWLADRAFVDLHPHPSLGITTGPHASAGYRATGVEGGRGSDRDIPVALTAARQCMASHP
mmetsp:Transcript_37776/g.67470  ORF Transcript_37776/g.67470 Transcript_37776/m.67470 type:complete len:343 (+) Transcript_37776:550-1578(+)